LRNADEQPNIETKGIPSFRSPVTTLNTYLPHNRDPVDHESFAEAVLSEFKRIYEIPNTPLMKVQYVTEADITEKKVWDGVKEMKTWEWEYGSSPEFSNVIEGELSFGSLVCPTPRIYKVVADGSLSH
jgi:lipoate-protein ligase A